MNGNISLSDSVLREIGSVADRRNTDVYVVGGYVRDLLLGKDVKDTDIVVVGDGVEFAKNAAQALGAAPPVLFENFGTAMMIVGDRKVEFVGARKESYLRTSRKPAVASGTLEEDLSRRDFTVNAMAASLRKETFGQLADPFGGQEDLRKKILRTPLEAEATFDDDPLRIMRLVRFAAQLNFQIDPDALRAAKAMVSRLSIVSQERISDEFMKIMACPRPSVGLALMQETDILEKVFPEIAQMEGVEQREEYHHKDVFRHTLQVVDKTAEASNDIWLRMTALLHDIGKPRTKAFKEGTGWTFHGHNEVGARMVRSIFRRMKLPLDHVPYIEKLVRLHLRPQALVDDGVTDSAVRRLMFEAGADVDDLMILCRADITSKNQKFVEKILTNYECVIRKMEEVEAKDRMRSWQPPLRGEEIMQICGLNQGVMVGILKDKITDAVLDGVIPNDHDAAMQFLLSIKDEVLAQVPVKKSGRKHEIAGQKPE
jgi:poly(A) polymerase